MKTPSSLNELSVLIEQCDRCERLRTYCAEIAVKKKAAYKAESYWGRPVGSFGDPLARLIILGLAPGAHGANRTGRLITGDKSGEWLFRALFETGFSSLPASTSRTDGLVLTDAYITNAIHCAPPQNKPNPEELDRCREYLKIELDLLLHKEVILALGAIAYQQILKAYALKKAPRFAHGLWVSIPNGPMILCSYHPSQQNTFTGRLKWDDWLLVFKKAKARIEQSSTGLSHELVE